jgi:hypothetical protein
VKDCPKLRAPRVPHSQVHPRRWAEIWERLVVVPAG